MNADWVFAEATRLLAAHNGDSLRDDWVRWHAANAREVARTAVEKLDEAVQSLAYAEYFHRGSGDVDAIAARIRESISTGDGVS